MNHRSEPTSLQLMAARYSRGIFGDTPWRTVGGCLLLFVAGLALSFAAAMHVARQDRRDRQALFQDNVQTNVSNALANIAKSEGHFDLASRLLGERDRSFSHFGPTFRRLFGEAGYACLFRAEGDARSFARVQAVVSNGRCSVGGFQNFAREVLKSRGPFGTLAAPIRQSRVYSRISHFAEGPALEFLRLHNHPAGLFRSHRMVASYAKVEMGPLFSSIPSISVTFSSEGAPPMQQGATLDWRELLFLAPSPKSLSRAARIPFREDGVNVRFVSSDPEFSASLAPARVILAVGVLLSFGLAAVMFGLLAHGRIVSLEVDRKTRELQVAIQREAEANQVKTRFLARLSHELRTPLNLILGMAQLLGESKLSSLQAEYVRSFQRAGRHLLELITDLLDFEVAEGEVPVLKGVPVNLASLVEEISDSFYVAAKKKGIEFFQTIELSVPRELVFERKRVSQVILNLLGNALKFTEHGNISLSIGYQKGLLRIAVSDTGIGMAPEHKEKIFQEFYQVDTSSQRVHGGLGLGLAIVDRIVRAMGGKVEVESELGRGTTFTVEVPVRAATEESWLGPPRENGHRVLYVGAPSRRRDKAVHALSALGFPVDAMPELPPEAALGAYGRIIVDFSLGLPNLAPGVAAALAAHASKVTLLACLVQTEAEHAALEEIPHSSILYAPLKLRGLLKIVEGRKVEAAAPQAPRPGPERELRVLVADDDEDNRLLLEAFLGPLGARLAFANDGQEALSQVLERLGELDLLITDLHMPRMDGQELIKLVRAEERKRGSERSLPIIVLTADVQFSRQASADACYFVTKPVDRKELVSLVSKVTAK